MAQYKHLPIYRDAMRLAVHIENTVSGFEELCAMACFRSVPGMGAPLPHFPRFPCETRKPDGEIIL
jgi:hypothetical protein